MDNIKRELSKKIKNAAKKQKLILLEVIFKLNVNGVIKEIVDDGNVPYYCFERLDTQQKGFSEGELNINDESRCNQKDEDVHEEVMLAKNFSLKEFLEIFHNNENAEYKSLEVDSNLEKIITICYGKKECSLGILSYTMRRTQALFKLLVISFHEEIKHLNSQCF